MDYETTCSRGVAEYARASRSAETAKITRTPSAGEARNFAIKSERARARGDPRRVSRVILSRRRRGVPRAPTRNPHTSAARLSTFARV